MGLGNMQLILHPLTTHGASVYHLCCVGQSYHCWSRIVCRFFYLWFLVCVRDGIAPMAISCASAGQHVSTGQHVATDVGTRTFCRTGPMPVQLADLCWGMVSQSHHRIRLGEFLLFGRLYRIISETTADRIRLATSQHTDGFFQKYGFSVESREADGFVEGLDKVEMLLELHATNRQRIETRWMELINASL